MSQKEITKYCECCGTERTLLNLHYVCLECLHQIRNEKQKELLYNTDWEEDENDKV